MVLLLLLYNTLTLRYKYSISLPLTRAFSFVCLNKSEQQANHSFNQFNSGYSFFLSLLIWFSSVSSSYIFMASTSKPGSSSELTITVESNPSKARLSELAINSWPK